VATGIIESVIPRLMVAAAMVSLFVPSSAAPSAKSESRPFIVRMGEWQSTFLPSAGPNSLTNCVVVLPDGRFELVLRRQESLNGNSTVDIFESSLDQKAIEILRDRLDSDAVRKLPPYVPPNTPFIAEEWQGVAAEISRASDVQQVGYFSWKGVGPTNPENIKKEWQESAVVLQPLVEWFRAFKSLGSSIPRAKWRRVSKEKYNPCGIAPRV
jgi:hypothetical protein